MTKPSVKVQAPLAAQPEELLGAPDLVPGLAVALAHTLSWAPRAAARGLVMTGGNDRPGWLVWSNDYRCVEEKWVE
jgi:hypothetical protein